MDYSEVTDTTALISKHFGVEQSEILPEKSGDTYDKLLEGLERLVAYLLAKDMNRLINGLYIIDVDETEFKLVIANSAPERVSRNLAELILKRELKKIAFRKKYSQN